MNYDEYNEVINGEDTYSKIAEELMKKDKCIIGWTDRKYDHRDILFTLNWSLLKFGNLQSGRHNCRLIISILGKSSEAFLIEDGSIDNRKHETYLKEKLKLNDSYCDNMICELINGVIEQIDKIRK